MAQGSSGPRRLFARSTTPVYEQRAGFLAPVFAFALAATGIWAIRRRLLQDAALLGMALFGALYFVSLPFILTAGGAEGARRSWAFTSLGLCLAVAVGLVAAADWARRREVERLPRRGRLARSPRRWPSSPSATSRAASACSTASRARSRTAPTRAPCRRRRAGRSGGWRRRRAPGNRTIADRDTGLAFGTLGTQWIEKAWKGFPLWEFYLQREAAQRRPCSTACGEAPRGT